MKFSNDRCAQFLVFYRDLPNAIETHVNSDGRMSIVKDGVKKFGTQSCPRATINVDIIDKAKDEARIESFLRLLENLESNNQIVAFKLKKAGR